MLFSRRDFLKQATCILTSLSFPVVHISWAKTIKFKQGLIKTKKAYFFKKLDKKAIMCTLCPRFCVVPEGKRGHCEVRENRGGVYYSLVYGNPCAVHIDPIEKKPFFHVLSGTRAFSIATAGCNLDCKFCQNWEISQARPEETFNYDLSPEDVVSLAKIYKCSAVTSTYVEPMIFYEYMYDIGKLLAEENILNTCHSNGFVNPEPLKTLCRYLDAVCIDLKGFSEKFYEEFTGGSLAPVLKTLKILKHQGVHAEIVNLIIPTKNDNLKMIEQMIEWIKAELGDSVPLHFTRFYPRYKLNNLPPTPVETLEKARELALKMGLKYVYIGNVPGHPGENTYCPHCHRLLIKRLGYRIEAFYIKNGTCGYCGFRIVGIWSKEKQKKSKQV